jgi:hypothetical protein
MEYSIHLLKRIYKYKSTSNYYLHYPPASLDCEENISNIRNIYKKLSICNKNLETYYKLKSIQKYNKKV